MFTKYKKALPGHKNFLSGKKPNSTNFNNSKSQLYLNTTSDLENYAPNEPIINNKQKRTTVNNLRPSGGKELLIDDPFCISEHSINDTMIPKTSKPVQCRLGNWSKKGIILGGTQKIEKLSPHDLPPPNEGDLNSSIMTIDSCEENNESVDILGNPLKKVQNDKYPVFFEIL